MINKLFISFLFSATSVAAADSNHKNLQQGYVGEKVCAECHVKESIQWSGSHHDLAMQKATLDTVLADFNDTRFTYNQITSNFYYKANKFWVRTDGPDGTLQDFIIQYTFGVYPLQQYLIEMPGGRLQALDIAWDTRLKEEGGQRWFHLHPDDSVDYKDVLHWTGANLNWNYMCADCHSTNLQKNYDAESDSYDTRWSELNVSCEACHGPGKAHQQWALSKDKVIDNKGLSISLNEREAVQWKINPVTGIAYRSIPRLTTTEIDTCARCHSRRSQFGQPDTGGNLDEVFLNNFRPALLTQGLYHSDGQIQDEVYVYGSFLQSKMYQAGVTCSDCHDPHFAGLKLPGDRVCNQCHLDEHYRTRQHHFHSASANASCLDCHMTSKTYMGNDQRHDHSFRIPRPDLSDTHKTPDACSQCHKDKTSQWAAQQLVHWYGEKESGLQNYASVMDAQRRQSSSAEKLAVNLLLNDSPPAIVRATVLSQLSTISTRETLGLIERQLQHKNALVRVSALNALDSLYAAGGLEFSQIAELAFSLLDDKVRLVRIEAARILAPLDKSQLTSEQQKKLQNALQEYIDSQLFNAERPESQVNLGNLYRSMNDYLKSEQAYRQALKLQAQFVPAWVNLAQLYADLQRDKDAVQTLQSGLQQVPENADLYHAIGLGQVRLKALVEAIVSLQKSAELAPENPRYSYVYGIALNSYQRPEEALLVLKKSHQLHPENMDILTALVSIHQDNGHSRDALFYAEKLLQLEPDNPAIQRYINDLKKQQ